jgi:hypothetical protein
MPWTPRRGDGFLRGDLSHPHHRLRAPPRVGFGYGRDRHASLKRIESTLEAALRGSVRGQGAWRWARMGERRVCTGLALPVQYTLHRPIIVVLA